MAGPKSWERFLEITKEEHDPNFAAFSRFRARYMLADGLESMTVSDLGQATTESYFAALRVTLAYTALEAYEKAAKTGPNSKVLNTHIRTSLLNLQNHAMLKELFRTIHPTHHSKEHRAFQSFLSEKSESLRPVAYAIRNLMSHGTLTAHRLGLDQSKTRRSLLNELAYEVLRTADNEFHKYVTGIANQQNKRK